MYHLLHILISKHNLQQQANILILDQAQTKQIMQSFKISNTCITVTLKNYMFKSKSLKHKIKLSAHMYKYSNN